MGIIEFIKSIATQRAKEIAKNKNYSTARPIYIVYDIVETLVPYEWDYISSTTYHSKFRDKREYVRICEDDGTEKKAERNEDLWDEARTIRGEDFTPVMQKAYHDKFITVCLTRKAAEQFMKNERHNLNNPYVFVDTIMWRNTEMVELLNLISESSKP